MKTLKYMIIFSIFKFSTIIFILLLAIPHFLFSIIIISAIFYSSFLYGAGGRNKNKVDLVFQHQPRVRGKGEGEV
jgi:hypothetical protein